MEMSWKWSLVISFKVKKTTKVNQSPMLLPNTWLIIESDAQNVKRISVSNVIRSHIIQEKLARSSKTLPFVGSVMKN